MKYSEIAKILLNSKNPLTKKMLSIKSGVKLSDIEKIIDFFLKENLVKGDDILGYSCTEYGKKLG